MSHPIDLLIVGGGVAGAALAMAMAKRGAEVLVVERETRFRDRVRGEALVPWGGREARALGLAAMLGDRSLVKELPRWTYQLGGFPYRQRDFLGEGPGGLGCLTFYHPAMQELLLQAAAASGACVWRGSSVTRVVPGDPCTVDVTTRTGWRSLRARLVVGADGRRSRTRGWAGLATQRDPDALRVAGVLLEGMNIPDDQVIDVLNPAICHHVILFPQPQGRTRAYISVHPDVEPRWFTGERRFKEFAEASIRTGAAASWYGDAKPIGPLAMYSGASEWVEHPYRDGVVLVSDAAGSADPSWGQGLALALRDVRMLRDLLIEASDWREAASEYARAHRASFERMHRFEGWFQDMFMNPSPAAATRLQRCLPLFMADISRIPQCFDTLGPDAACDEEARQRFFGE